MASNWQQRKSYADVLGHRMAYVAEGQGAPIVLLHGNPTSDRRGDRRMAVPHPLTSRQSGTIVSTRPVVTS
jgi:pimeloyl-ACP methyl ester carboxylesterase